MVPSTWDSVRHECDKTQDTGKFILTGSTTLSKEEKVDEVFHSGTGRIASMHMYLMSLYESGDSSGNVSITDMFNDKVECKYEKKQNLMNLQI